MAGIGFRLRRMLEKESFVSQILAFAYSVIISTGPWIITSFTILLLQLLFSKYSLSFFRISIIYAFIFSNIIVGIFSMVFMRKISDYVYERKYEKIFEAYNFLIFFFFLISTFILITFYSINRGYDFIHVIPSSWLFVLLNLLWMQLIFISVVQEFGLIILGFAIGSIISFISSTFLGKKYGEMGVYFGYDLGIAFVLFFFHIQISKLFSGKGVNWKFLNILKKYKFHFLTGLFYYLGIWVDDFIAWGFFGKSEFPGFVLYANYDVPMFLSYIFVIPTFALFVLNIETYFYSEYRKFYESIESNRSYTEIILQKRRMDIILKRSLKNVFIIQGSISAFMILYAPIFANSIEGLSLKIFRYAMAGATFNAFFLFVMLLAFYFDFSDITFKSSLLLFLSNSVLTFITIKSEPGLGFFLAFLISFSYVYYTFYKRYTNLLYFEFSRQESGLKKGRINIWKKQKEVN